MTPHQVHSVRPMEGSKANIAVKFAMVTRGALNVVLRFSEALQRGPQMVTNHTPDSVDVGWRWSEAPEGLTVEQAGPDFVVRLSYDRMHEGGMSIDAFYGPNCPEAAEKHKITTDVLELLKIEMQQKGMTVPDERGGL